MYSIFKLLALFIIKGDVVFDVNFGDGLYFFQMAELVGPLGSIVGFERSEVMFQQLKALPAIESLWNMSLLINSAPASSESILPMLYHWDHAHNTFPNTPSEVYFQLNKQCPKLMRVASRSNYIRGDIHSSLLSSLAVLEHCQPVILMEFDANESVDPVLELFAVLNQVFRLYWYRPEGDTSDLRRVLAVPQDMYLNLKYLEPELKALPSDELFTVSLRNSGTAEAINQEEHYQRRFIIDTDVIVSSLTTQGLIQGLHETTATLHGTAILYDSRLSQDVLLLIANATCLVWSRQLFHALLSLEDTATGAKVNSELTASHLWDVYTNCTSFAQYRVEFVHNMVEQRRSFKFDAASYQHTVSLGTSSSSSGSDGVSGSHTGPARSVVEKVLLHDPFDLLYDEEVCAEPVWCSHTLSMQQRLRLWQFPDDNTATTPSYHRSSSDSSTRGTRAFAAAAAPSKPFPLSGRTCANSKFLVFEPPSVNNGIGSMLESIVAAFRYAICLDRILVLLPVEQAQTTLKWRHPGCTGNVFECYFEPIHGCEGAFTVEELWAAHVSENGEGFEEYPRRDERILVLTDLPSKGSCSACHSEWVRGSRFFDGWYYRHEGYNQSDYYQLEMLHVDAFMTSIKQTWAAQLLRFLMRPRRWFSQLLRESVALSLVGPSTSTPAATATSTTAAGGGSFASLHVRFGNKVAEVALQPLTRYMAVVGAKLPHLRDVFVSTETESVLTTLNRDYPQYRFHYLHYSRIEFLVFGVAVSNDTTSGGTNPKALHSGYTEIYLQSQRGLYVSEWIMSLANLYVAAEADGFVGTLSSNWCMMILQLERTRGDGGYDYLSVDGGSAFTTCF